MGSRVFDTKNVILLKTDEADLNSFLVDKDLDDSGHYSVRMDDFSDAIIETIPEYVFADYHGDGFQLTSSVSKIREAARSIYQIKEYKLMYRWYVNNDRQAYEELERANHLNRGEFGELLLHLLLRDFKGTLPLISKVYFKDSTGVPAHGFDAVHITPGERILWLGESKLYSDAKGGIDALIKDLNEHIKKDYLREQFLIIKKNLENNTIPGRKEWVDILTKCNKLEDIIRMINIPMLCIYSNDIYNRFLDINSNEAVRYRELNIRELKSYFDSHNTHPLKPQLNIVLMLFPIENKNELVKNLHLRLWHMQNM